MPKHENRELQAFLDDLKRRHAACRWAVVVFRPRIEYFTSKQEALEALRTVEASYRGALVDLETGNTLVRKRLYRKIMALLRKRGRAPQHFRRTGDIGVIRT